MMVLKVLILLFLLASIGALFYGLYFLVTSKTSSIQLFNSLKYRVIFAAMTLALIGLHFLLNHS